MKIQTQARLLVAGIVAAPLLIVLTNFIFRNFMNETELSGMPVYEEIQALMNENISARDRETIIRTVDRSRNMGQAAIFLENYLVLYSTIPEFIPGEFSSGGNILSLLDDENQSFDYFFVSQKLEENRIYILNKTMPQQSGPRPPPFFIPAVFIFLFVILLTIFAVSMSIVITRTITHSVQVLENATRRIAGGELDLKVDVRGSNEITSLTNSLNKMRDTLKEEELRRSRFIMGITHDLKTPLALIKGYAEAIEDGVAQDTLSHSGAAEIIADKADQLEGMINDLIGFVRMETGEWREKLCEINAAAFLGNLVNTLGRDVELLHHEFISEIDLPENLAVQMDEKLVQRALENLINNAIRHTPQGSVIRFTAGLQKDSIAITISDNGPGIESGALPHVFEMFYKGSPSRREQGMGLGLAVVKWVTDYHGWTISVSSEKGRGTEFAIKIPLEKKTGTVGSV